MTNFLIFQLYGPMASWGGMAMGEMRPSWDFPTPSALLGLVAGALGLLRHEEERLAGLHQSLATASLVRRAGDRLSDYHTAQSSTQSKKFSPPHRRAEVGLPRHELNTILSQREYYPDQYSQIALTLKSPGEFSLEEIAQALARPRLTPYLGRKAHPLALPASPKLLQAATATEAFAQAGYEIPPFFAQTKQALYWQGGLESGAQPRQTYRLPTLPFRRDKWLFLPEELYYAPINGEK